MSDVVLLAGLKVEMQKADDTWSRVPRLTSLGAVGEQSEAKEKTTLEDRQKKYGSGLRDAEDKNLQGQYIPIQSMGDEYYDDFLLQQAFITRCRNEEEFNVRITWPDGEVTGFLWKSLGFQFDEGTQEDWKMFTVNGKQNSRVIYSVSLTGTSTVTEGEQIDDLELTIVPGNLDSLEYDVMWSSSDENIATVDNSGVVTGVAAGTATITASVRGVMASLEVTVSA